MFDAFGYAVGYVIGMVALEKKFGASGFEVLFVPFDEFDGT